MGVTFSTFILLIGSLGGGISSSMAANFVREGKWESAKVTSGVTMGVQIALFLFTLFVIIRSHTDFLTLPGVIIAFILLLIATAGTAILNMIALIGESSDDPKNSRAFSTSVGAAVLSFGIFILSILIIIFLL